tara:strand:- start:544 stop:726 length:183 start_codon:yes stop_codon:yes gene_type:complete
MSTDNDMITSAIEEVKELKELGLTPDDVMTLIKGYEKFNESSDEERKELMSGIKQLIGSQ